MYSPFGVHFQQSFGLLYLRYGIGAFGRGCCISLADDVADGLANTHSLILLSELECYLYMRQALHISILLRSYLHTL